MRQYIIRGRRPPRSFLSGIRDWSIVGKIILVTVVISVVAYILMMAFPSSVEYLALKPLNILSGKALWTLVLHIFVHGGFFHLFINMFVLFSLGSLCEKIIGKKRFIWFYLISGIFAGLLSVVLAGFYGYGFLEKVFGSPDVYMVGASGAIFAIAGLFVVLLPRLKFVIIFLPFFSLPAYVMVPLVLFLTWIATIAAGLPIGNVAHFGGFLAGLAYGYYLKRKYWRKIKMIRRAFR
jgi:membrane associated rhomboid family serine protease